MHIWKSNMLMGRSSDDEQGLSAAPSASRPSAQAEGAAITIANTIMAATNDTDGLLLNNTPLTSSRQRRRVISPVALCNATKHEGLQRLAQLPKTPIHRSRSKEILESSPREDSQKSLCTSPHILGPM
jgi:hypothetical protein